MHRCPHALAREPETVRLLPFLSRYYQYGIYPNAGAILDQPSAMVDVFEIYVSIVKKIEAEEEEKRWRQPLK
jgi:hypothetical protein